MDVKEIIKIIDDVAFYKVPEDPNIVYVNLEKLKDALKSKQK